MSIVRYGSKVRLIFHRIESPVLCVYRYCANTTPSNLFPMAKRNRRPSKQKRERKKRHVEVPSTSKIQGDLPSQSTVCPLQSILGDQVNSFTLSSFLEKFVPALSDSERSYRNKGLCNDEIKELDQLCIVPIGDILPLTRLSAPRQAQSLASLVDDVVWTLVQKRERSSKVKHHPLGIESGQNLLVQGYVINTDSTGSSLTSHAALTQLHLNSCVDFCKVNRVFRNLHNLYGDDCIRILLLKTSLFLRFSQNQNSMQLSGPPLLSLTRRVVEPSTNHPDLHPRTLLPQRMRRTLFYSNAFIPKVGLDQRHILNNTSPEQPHLLLRGMFQILFLPRSFQRGKSHMSGMERWKYRLEKRLCQVTATQLHATEIAHAILVRHRKTDYHRTLERYCAIPTAIQDVMQKESAWDPKEALALISTKGHIPHAQVISWVRSIFHSVFPVECWGCNEQRIFTHLIPAYVKLRRDEHFSHMTLLENMRVTRIPWLKQLCSFTGNQSASHRSKGKVTSKFSRGDHERCRFLLQCFLQWVFSDFLVPLLRANFFITESEFTGRTLLYYRKPVWARFRNLSIHKLSSAQYNRCSVEEVQAQLTCLGLSRLRLLPKSTGVRPIATLCKQESALLGCRRGPSTNSVLRDAFNVLRYESERQPESYGCGLPGLHYFYTRYRDFIQSVPDGKSLYFGSVDIRNCFDTIDQGFLMNVVENLIQDDEYVVQRHKVIHHSATAGRVVSKLKTFVCPLQDFQPMSHDGDQSHLPVVANAWRSIVVKASTGSCITKSRRHVLDTIRDHLTRNFLVIRGRFGNQYIWQKKGIPQGSILSSLLCNLYYGSIEKRLLAHLSRASGESIPHQLLVRMVDDFLLVSTEHDLIRQFQFIMEQGEPSLGVEINPDKTKVSFDMEDDGRIMDKASLPCSSSSFFSWCGMLFHTHTGEVRIDYKRLLEREGMGAISMDRTISPGQHLIQFLASTVRPRCLPILYDEGINKIETQRLNFYQMFVFSSVKLIIYIECHDLWSMMERNVPFFLSVMDLTIGKALELTQRRLRTHHPPSQSSLTMDMAHTLGWQGYCDVFRNLSGEVSREILHAMENQLKVNLDHGQQQPEYHRPERHHRRSLKCSSRSEYYETMRPLIATVLALS